MAGRLLGPDRSTALDPCDDYAGFPLGCPTAATTGFDVAIGRPGLTDIVPIATLLRAAGIGSLDEPAGLSAPDAGESRREAGLVLTLDIAYSNYFAGGALGGGAVGTGSLDGSVVEYTYRVSTVAATEYKLVTGMSPYGNGSVRENLNRHGLRILVTTSGRVGLFDAMTLLINLNVAFGMLGLSYLIMDCVITQCGTACCPLRGVYRQFKERRTVDMSDLRKAAAADPGALRRIQERFEEDDYVVDPNPDILMGLVQGYGGGGGGKGPGRPAGGGGASGGDGQAGSLTEGRGGGGGEARDPLLGGTAGRP